MTVVAQNNSEQRNPEIASTFESIEWDVKLETRLEGVPKQAIPIVREFCLNEIQLRNEIKELKEERQKFIDQVNELHRNEIELRESRSSERSVHSAVSVINAELRRQLGKYYDLSVWAAVGIIFADAISDWSSVDCSIIVRDWNSASPSEIISLIFVVIGTLVRILGGAALLFCAHMNAPAKEKENDVPQSTDSVS